MPQWTLHSPLGELTLSEEDGALVALDWGRGRDQVATPLLRAAAEQLHEYFDGERLSFQLPLAPQGTPFQRRVWDALCRIPPGETRSYIAVARELGTAARAVGQANGRNPIPIIIPCHRVVGTNGPRGENLGGYSAEGGLDTKRFLLDLEARSLSGNPS